MIDHWRKLPLRSPLPELVFARTSVAALPDGSTELASVLSGRHPGHDPTQFILIHDAEIGLRQGEALFRGFSVLVDCCGRVISFLISTPS